MSMKMEEIIRGAIAQEEAAHTFYRRLADLMEHAKTKETFQFLAGEELEHQRFLEGCFTPQGCKLAGNPKEANLAALLEAPAIHLGMTPKEALAVAIKQEEVAHGFYQALAALQPTGATRDFLEKIAQMESGHKAKLEYIFNNTAFPKGW